MKKAHYERIINTASGFTIVEQPGFAVYESPQFSGEESIRKIAAEFHKES